MTRYRSTPGGFINLDTGLFEPTVYRQYNEANPAPLPRIYTGDETEPLVSMVDGKTYTSKAAMRESYKASNNPRGTEFVEVGDDAGYLNPVHKPLEADKTDIALALDKAEAAVARGEFDHVE